MDVAEWVVVDLEACVGHRLQEADAQDSRLDLGDGPLRLPLQWPLYVYFP